LTYCTYFRAFDPAFKDDIPYAVGYVELDDGPRMYGQMSGSIEELEVGQPVRASFERVTPEVTLVRWTKSNGLIPDAES
jgi:uncharacterized OB-fold protein